MSTLGAIAGGVGSSLLKNAVQPSSQSSFTSPMVGGGSVGGTTQSFNGGQTQPSLGSMLAAKLTADAIPVTQTAAQQAVQGLDTNLADFNKMYPGQIDTIDYKRMYPGQVTQIPGKIPGQ